MIRQAIAPQMLLTDEQQIDAVFFRFLADGFGVLHVRGKYRGRHAETVKNGLRLFDKAFRFGAGHELGEIGLAELVVDGKEVEMTKELLEQGAQFVHPAMTFMGFEGKPAGYFIIFCVCAVAYLLGWVIMKALVPKYKPIVLD